MPDPHEFDINIQLSKMRSDLDEMREEQPRDHLKDISSDDAFELGYESALHEIERAIKGDTLEVRAVEIPIPVAPADPKMFDGVDLYFPKEN